MLLETHLQMLARSVPFGRFADPLNRSIEDRSIVKVQKKNEYNFFLMK